MGLVRGCGVALTAVAALGCSANQGETSADCTTQVRAEGAVYSSHGFTERNATRHGVADRAECDDTSSDPRGSYFPDSPGQVTTWTFAGYPPEKVLGVRFDEKRFAVFVAETVGREESNQIFEDLDSDRR